MSLVIHVGIPKSGTTFLQTQIFAKCAGLRCIGRPYHHEESYRRFYNAVMHEEIDRTARQEIRHFFETHGGADPEQPVILSDESLTFSPLFHVVARRLFDVVPDARILITLRSQLTAITSFYANHGRLLRGVPQPYRGRYVAFDDWLRFAHENIDRHYQKNYLRILFYDRLFDSFADVFGPDRVNVMMYEQMNSDHRAFALQLSEVLGVDCTAAFEAGRRERANPRSSRRQLAYSSFRSHYPFSMKAIRRLPGFSVARDALHGHLKKGLAIKVELSQEQRTLIEQLFGDSNRRLAEQRGLPLGAHGYPIQPAVARDRAAGTPQ